MILNVQFVGVNEINNLDYKNNICIFMYNMEEIRDRIWGEYMNINGGNFSQWYEGLSPIELYLFKREKNTN